MRNQAVESHSQGEKFSYRITFLIMLLEECRKSDINTCIDTTGFASEAVLRRALPLTDTFLFDIKLIDDEAHKKNTAVFRINVF